MNIHPIIRERRLGDGKRCRELIEFMKYSLGNCCRSPLDNKLREKELAQFINSVRK